MKRKLYLSSLFIGVISLAGCGGASFLPNSQTSTIAAVSVTCSPSSVSTGGTTQCLAVVTGSGAYSSDVTWTADSGIISSSGLYTAPAANPASGSATVTATSRQDKNKIGHGVLSFGKPSNTSYVSGVVVVARPSSLTMGQTANCIVTVSGIGSYSTAVSWTATGGTITESGVFTPSGPGAGRCTAYSAQDDTKSGSATINTAAAPISAAVTGVVVIANPSSINTSQTATCVANVSGTGAFSNRVTWTATGGAITPAGVFTPSGTGTGTCKATSMQSGYTTVAGQAAITVTALAPTVTGIAVVANPSAINTSQTATCSATVSGTGAFATGVTWTATGGTITSAGVFTPSGTGTGSCIARSTQPGSTNVTGQSAINVTGSGTATLSVNATTIAFGSVNLNTPATQSVMLTSTGTTAVTISAASVTGTGFSISGATYPFTLNPNQTATLFVAFDPTVTGSATGQLRIVSNSSSGATTVVSLTGTGQSIAYDVNLSWNAPVSSTDPVAGYNVFRSPTGTAAYQQLNTSIVTITSYVDGNVQNGTSYEYIVESVDASGGSSVPSNTFTAAIP